MRIEMMFPPKDLLMSLQEAIDGLCTYMRQHPEHQSLRTFRDNYMIVAWRFKETNRFNVVLSENPVTMLVDMEDTK